MLFASGVFWANLNFSSPRVPRVATLPYFFVLVVKENLKLSPKYLPGVCARGAALFKSTARYADTLARYSFAF